MNNHRQYPYQLGQRRYRGSLTRVGGLVVASILVLFLSALFSSLLAASGEPSRVSAAIESRTWVVDQHHPEASDEGTGTATQPFKTISRAATLATPGDTVWVKAGVYRERVTPARGGEPHRPITYQAAPGETVIVKGSEQWAPDPEPLDAAKEIYSGPLDPALFGDYNPYRIRLKRMDGNLTLGQVFIAGQPADEVDSMAALEATANSWLVDSDAERLYIHFPPAPIPPTARPVEITVRSRTFAPHIRGLGYIQVKGFIFEHAANQFPSGFWASKDSPQAGSVSTRSGHHWVIEDNVIRYAKAIGLDCGSEGKYDLEGNQPTPEGVGYHQIRHNVISDNGCCGLAGWKQTGTTIIGNQIERNNRLGWTAPETGGIKVHRFVDGLIEGNLIRDNDAFGIWLDNVYRQSRVTRNVIVNNQGAGVFVEMGGGPILVDTNAIAYTRLGDGIYTHDASGVTLAHNLLYANTHFGVYMRTVSERQFTKANGERQQVGTSHQRIYNNVFVDNYRGHISLPLPSERGFDNKSDYNLLINGTQWTWEGLGFHRFVLNTNDGRIPAEQLTETLKTALADHDVPAAQQPNFAHWSEQPYLTLDWWRLLTDNDRHSMAPEIHTGDVENGAIAKGSMNFAARNLLVEFSSSAPLQTLHPPAVPGVDQDLLGQPLPNQALLAGPFQQLEGDALRLHLWPVPLPAESP